jgi:hypothetical protein
LTLLASRLTRMPLSLVDHHTAHSSASGWILSKDAA